MNVAFSHVLGSDTQSFGISVLALVRHLRDSAPNRIKASTSSFIIILTCSLSDTSFIIIWSIILWWAPLGRLLMAVSSRIGPEALKRSLIQLVLSAT
jgi:hypothetical protein